MEGRNPFSFGSPVRDAAHFCDRKTELSAITDLMLNGQNAILLSPRRYGKTSLLYRAIDMVRRRKGRTGYASLARCTSRREVAQELLRATMNGPLSTLRRSRVRLQDAVRNFSVRPDLYIETDGRIGVRFGVVAREEEWSPVMADVLRLLRRAGDSNHPASLVVDEFQRVSKIHHDIGGQFKALADELSDVSLVLSGSQLHMMRELAVGSGAALYGMGELIYLDVVPEGAMMDYLCRRARAGGKPMLPDVATRLYQLVDGVSNDVQRLAYSAYAEAYDAVDDAAVDRGLDAILRHQSVEFQERFANLADAPSQQRLLRYLAAHPGRNLYSKAVLDELEVANANAVRTALTVLDRNELIVEHDGEWRVANPFFREWLCEEV
jgi:uncharacterized protein